jgi:DNA repair/transcription protein MET18/MMS19
LLFSKLPDTAPLLIAVEDRAQYRQILTSLSTLCAAAGLFETLVIRVLTKLDTICEIKAARADLMDVDTSEEQQVERECNIAYAHALLTALLDTLRSKVQAQHKDVAKYFDQIVPRLFSIFVPASVSKPLPLAADVRLLGVAASVIEVMTQTLPQEYVK